MRQFLVLLCNITQLFYSKENQLAVQYWGRDFKWMQKKVARNLVVCELEPNVIPLGLEIWAEAKFHGHFLAWG